MVLDEETKFRDRILDLLQLLFKPFEHAAETVVLNQKQELLFGAAVMIQAREAHVSGARDVAHRRGVITLLGEDTRRSAQNKLELLIVTRNGQCYQASPWLVCFLCVSVSLWFQ